MEEATDSPISSSATGKRVSHTFPNKTFEAVTTFMHDFLCRDENKKHGMKTAMFKEIFDSWGTVRQTAETWYNLVCFISFDSR